MEQHWGKWLALGMLLIHSAIYDSIPQTMLDFPMTAILLLTLALYLKTLKSSSSKWTYLLFGFSAGLLMLSKYPFPLLFLLIALLYLSLFLQKIPSKRLVATILTTITTYFFGYILYFTQGGSLIEFIRFEWWRWNWFSGKTDSPKGMIWQTIFSGRYPKWWDVDGGYISSPHWNIYWPASHLLYLASWTTRYIYKNPLFPYQIWILISLLAYSLGVAEDRFLIPLIPGFALFGTKFIEKLLVPDKNGIIKR
jgi:4-amino-4-deoxy-L-arabinose transferase-like glycosyltransferase